MKKIRRFTLIELLAVMAIIAILSGIGFGAYTFANNKAKESSTEALMKQIEAGLESFHTKNGYYPRSNSGFSAITFTLASDGTVSAINFGSDELTKVSAPATRAARLNNELFESFAKPLDLEVIKKNLNDSRQLEDAWGGIIYYCAPGLLKRGSFDLISAGPDGTFGTGNAANMNGITDVALFRENDGTSLCDDLFNF
jgi:prepilin-type N-terminal cleavage/methylation domain-containing protein